MSKFIYKTKTATQEEIYIHLKECNNNFSPPLSKKVDIQKYSKKIFEKSLTFEAWLDNILIGLIAAYFNNLENHSAYITNVSITDNHKGKGIASELLNMCINHAKKNNFDAIELEVFKDNLNAILLYKKFGFFEFERKNDMIVMKFEIKK